MAEFEPLEEEFQVPDNLFEDDLVDVTDLSKWISHYEQPFPPVVRYYLTDIMENWVKLEYYARDDPAFAERVLSELQMKANKLPISEVAQVARQEILTFVRTHIDDPSRFLELIRDNYNRETQFDNSEHSNVVVTLSRASYDLKKKLASIKQKISYHKSTTISGQLANDVAEYYRELGETVAKCAGIKDYVQQTLEKLRNYQAQESECEKFYVKEMADIWEKLLLTIDTLFWLIKETNDVCSCDSVIDETPLVMAQDELVASSMIIVESPRINERTLRVKKKKVTYALQIILPNLDGPVNVTPYLLSEEGYTRLRSSPVDAEPDHKDVGTSDLYSGDQPVIKDPNSSQYRCVFGELGFNSMSRERKRARSGMVMTIKLAYMFRAKLKFRGREIWSRVFSMPVVTSTHNDQAVHGTATLFWDAYFPQEERIGMETRTNVSWNEIALALKQLIFRQTGRRITDLNVRFLRSIFLGRRQQEEGFDDDMQCFQLKDFLTPTERGTTFWEWLWGTLSMLNAKENPFLLNLWRNGYVVGYISQEDAHQVISDRLQLERKHYFLLRFSKRDGKAIVLQGYIEGSDPNKEPLGIFSVLPYKLEHLKETSLQHRIMKRRDCQEIVFETQICDWSSEPKEKVFQLEEHLRHLTTSSLPSGYVDREMSECTTRVSKPETLEIETEMVVEELDLTNRIP